MGRATAVSLVVLAAGGIVVGAGAGDRSEGPPEARLPAEAVRSETPAPEIDSLETRVDRFVEDALAELGFVSGLSVAVVHDGEIAYEGGFGWADVAREERATPHTIYYTASLSKALTGMAAAVLDAEDVLDLDAPIAGYYPTLRFSPPLAPADSTTVRHLLSHTPRFLNSGVNFYTTFVGRYGDDGLARILAEYSQPNEGFSYSNMSYALVSDILGKAAGEAWQDVIASRVFEPVGMRHSTAYASRLPIRGVATPHLWTGTGFEIQPPLKTDDKITGAGGFFSTAHDLARYVIANLRSGRVDGRQALPRAAARDAQEPQTPVSAEFFEFDRFAYGLGLYHADYDGDTLVHHFGGIPGGFRSHMSFMPEHGIGVVVLQNTGGPAGAFPHIVATYAYDILTGRPDADDRARERLEAMVERAPETLRSLTEQRARRDSIVEAGPVPALRLGAYLGTYENQRLGHVRIRPGVDGLRAQWGEIDAPMLPLGGHDFLVQWQPGYPPATWTFEVAEQEVDGFTWGARPFPRVAR